MINNAKKQYFAKLFTDCQHDMKNKLKKKQVMGCSSDISIDDNLIKYTRDTSKNIGNKFVETFSINFTNNIHHSNETLFKSFLVSNGSSVERFEKTIFLPDILVAEIEKLDKTVKKRPQV